MILDTFLGEEISRLLRHVFTCKVSHDHLQLIFFSEICYFGEPPLNPISNKLILVFQSIRPSMFWTIISENSTVVYPSIEVTDDEIKSRITLVSCFTALLIDSALSFS
jgi:hypothetical protein